MKMKSVDPHTGGYIKKEFFKREIILVLEIMPQFLRFENEPLLQQVSQQQEEQVASDDIKECGGQGSV